MISSNEWTVNYTTKGRTTLRPYVNSRTKIISKDLWMFIKFNLGLQTLGGLREGLLGFKTLWVTLPGTKPDYVSNRLRPGCPV